MLQSCGNYQKKSHIPHDCEHIDLYTSPISHKFYTKIMRHPIKYSFPKACIHELYGTLIWSKIHHFFTNRHIYQFCTQNRFTFIYVSNWYIEHYKYFCCTLLQEGRPSWAAYFFYKRKIWIAAIYLGLQNALKKSCNSSICNYYETNNAIIV